MKRAVALLLPVALLCTLGGCRRVSLWEDFSDYSIIEEQIITRVVPKTDNASSSAPSLSKGEASGGSSQNRATGGASQSSSSTAPGRTAGQIAAPKTAPKEEYNTYRTVEITEDIELEAPPETSIASFSHTILSQTEYYQYNALSDTEKAIYQTVCTAVEQGGVRVRLAAFDCTPDTVYKVFQAVMADHPQYFHIAKNFTYSYNTRTGSVNALILVYTDGVLTDRYLSNGRLAESADRSLISRQIEDFNSRVAAVTAQIPTAADEAEKEKQLYDFVQRHVAYSEGTIDYNAQTIRDFDAYGALCGAAVCEGYAKLFQYLCYAVGLNATQVYGTANGESHMWNAVRLDGAWYMADVTWDDPENGDLCEYDYFNLTTKELAEDHTVDNGSLSFPLCTATECAFYRTAALWFESAGAPPVNYQAVLDRLTAQGDAYLCVYIGNIEAALRDTLSTQVFSSRSAVQKYIKAKQYVLSFDRSYYAGLRYAYIPVKK